MLKQDAFGRVERGHSSGSGGPNAATVRRDLRPARRGVAWLARRLAAREARALEALEGAPGFPRLLAHGRDGLLRSWLAGEPMQRARPAEVAYFDAARRLLAQMHRRGVAHSDLAKEPNWLVQPDGRPAVVDFQLASVSPRRGRWFRLKAREDLRHLAKHKRTYCPAALTERERRLLARPAWPSRLWRRTGKPVYLFVTRRLLGWADREGAGDR